MSRWPWPGLVGAAVVTAAVISPILIGAAVPAGAAAGPVVPATAAPAGTRVASPTESPVQAASPRSPHQPAQQPTRRRTGDREPDTPDPAGGDPRSHELLRLDCATDLGHREVTLFANGTVRLRQGPPGEETMALAELNPDETATYVEQLSEVDLSETDAVSAGPGGAWVERCTLTLGLPGRRPEELRFSRFASLSLALARVVGIADTLIERAEAAGPLGTGERLPTGYEPAPGDVLATRDGISFEVVAFTSDGDGVELQGVDQPVTLYLRPEDLRREFVTLVSRSGR